MMAVVLPLLRMDIFIADLKQACRISRLGLALAKKGSRTIGLSPGGIGD